MIRKLLGLVFNRWVLLAVLLGALAAVIWTVGPLVAVAGHEPLATETARWIAVGSVVGAALLLVALSAWRARRGNAAVVQQLAATQPEARASESADLAAVRERFERALATLRRARFGSGGKLLGNWAARFGGRYLYELPWYLIIGAPGSGKTTALQHCGLKFPLADRVGDHALRGVGGTRHCDWWFTDQAVLIDTAGRFTTQDSDRDGDRDTWSGFLRMLAKARPRQPVNGVLVTVSVPDLLTFDADARGTYAATVRARIQELQHDLAIRLPVYLLVTKCDLLAGFMDTFAALDRDQREAPWGCTFALDADAAALPAQLDAEFDRLRQRLTDGLVDRLQAERDPRRRAAIHAFPSQFAGLQALLRDFVDDAFSPSRFDDAAPLLRGVYGISGTQEGTPIDRILGQVARSHRIEHALLAPNQSSGRSYFLTRLLGEVVFAESGIAGTNLRWERRRLQLAVAGYALIALATVGTLAAWGVSYANNRAYVDAVGARADAVRHQLGTTPNRHSADLLPIVPALEATRALADPDAGGTPPRALGFGLFQGDKLASAAHAAYARMLVDAVQPRLALRVEDQLRLGGDAGESQYEALKTYLMLHDPAHADARAIKAHVERDWDAQLAREISAEQRRQLGAHLDALLAQGAVVSPLPADAALVATTRAQLGSVALPDRIYARMRSAGFGSGYPDFNLVDAAGSNAALVFTRASGRPLTQGVPGIFTHDGYHKGFQSEVGRVAAELADEQGWVLGIAPAAGTVAKLAPVANAALADRVRRLYLVEYAQTWEAYIADIRVVPLTSLSVSMQTARLLAAADSPLPRLVRRMARETTLAVPVGGGKVSATFQSAASAIRGTVGTITGTPVAGGQALEAQLVDDRFRSLRQFAYAPDGAAKAKVDDVVALLGELNVLLQAVETALKGGAAPPPSPLSARLKAEAAQAPQPVRAMLETLADSSARSASGSLRASLSALVKAEVGEFCSAAIARRYPVDPRATLDATQADFAQLFGPGGRIDKLLAGPLAPYVDTSARPAWRFRPVEGTALGSDVGTLPQFQRAATIRETFFPGGATPALRLEFKPVEMDTTIGSFILDVDGQIVRYGHGPVIPAAVQWPGPRGSSQVRVQVTAQNGTPNAMMVTDGPWALFRMFDRTRIEPGASPNLFRVTFDLDGRKAVFDVTSSSVRNPFRFAELKDFSCPQGL